MGKNKRGVRDGTGPFSGSYERKSGGGGRRDKCYLNPAKGRTGRGLGHVIENTSGNIGLMSDKFHAGSESTAKWTATIKPKNSAIKTP